MATDSTQQQPAERDELISQSERAEAEATTEREARAANLFDLRRIIGGLFAIYGVILFVMGIAASQKEIDKAAGWNLNLWVGLAMIIVAAIFIGWALARPLSDQLDDEEESETPGGQARFDHEGAEREVGARP